MSNFQETAKVGVAQSNILINKDSDNQTPNKEQKNLQRAASLQRSADQSLDLTKRPLNQSKELSKSRITNTSSSRSTTSKSAANSTKSKKRLQTYILNCEEILGLGIVRGHRIKDKTVAIYNEKGERLIVESYSVYMLLNHAASHCAFAPPEFIQDLPKYIKDKLLKVLLAFEFDEYDQWKIDSISTLKAACRKGGKDTCISFPRKPIQQRELSEPQA